MPNNNPIASDLFVDWDENVNGNRDSRNLLIFRIPYHYLYLTSDIVTNRYGQVTLPYPVPNTDTLSPNSSVSTRTASAAYFVFVVTSSVFRSTISVAQGTSSRSSGSTAPSRCGRARRARRARPR